MKAKDVSKLARKLYIEIEENGNDKDEESEILTNNFTPLEEASKIEKEESTMIFSEKDSILPD